MATLLKEKIDKDLSEALRSKDELRLGTLRLVSAAIHNREIEKRTALAKQGEVGSKGGPSPRRNGLQPREGGSRELSDDEVLEVLSREAKKRKEAATIYGKVGRSELETKELAELKIIESYLPAELGEKEVRALVDRAFEALHPAGDKDFGRTMGEVMKSAGGRIDSVLASRLIKEKLGK